MMMKQDKVVLAIMVAILLASAGASTADEADSKPVVAIIGTGDMGDSLGPRFAELGYTVIYGSRHPDGDKAQGVVLLTARTPE